jgi:hypothetical protein
MRLAWTFCFFMTTWDIGFKGQSPQIFRLIPCCQLSDYKSLVNQLSLASELKCREWLQSGDLAKL